jgi:NADH dehydrogenase/NADH:ubiquinone oxidoreductase subunit G
MGETLVTTTINGREARVPVDSTVLEAARSIGVHIPTLCYHPALAPYGACRLCLVEIKRGNRSRIVTSCTFHIREEGLEILTHSDRVLRNRRVVVELLLARCPNVKMLQELGEELGVQKPRFVASKPAENCILCGLCVRVCEELIGESAISFVGRGPGREVATPFLEPSEACIGCGACAFVCPTHAIDVQDVLQLRKLDKWNASLPKHQCVRCGNYFAPQAELDKLAGKLELIKTWLEVCPDCRRELAASDWIVGLRAEPASSPRGK